MSLPLFLTLARIFIGPVFFIIYLYYPFIGIDKEILPYLLLFLLGLIELSDALDGFFARRFNQVTDLGKVLDPLADSTTRNAIFLTLTAPPINMPLFIVLLFFYRDLLVGGLRTLLALKGIPLAARPSGKLKAIFQALASFAIILLLIPYSKGSLSQTALTTLATWIGSITAVYSVASGFEYFIAHRTFIRRF